MGSFTFISVLIFIHGIIQIVYPDIFIKLKIEGAYTRKGVRFSGYFVIIVGTMLFTFDLIR